jgi:hypothetical protein
METTNGVHKLRVATLMAVDKRKETRLDPPIGKARLTERSEGNYLLFMLALDLGLSQIQDAYI